MYALFLEPCAVLCFVNPHASWDVLLLLCVYGYLGEVKQLLFLLKAIKIFNIIYIYSIYHNTLYTVKSK